MKMTSMKLPKKSKKEMMNTGLDSPMGYEGDKYPYGLELRLDTDSLKMLGLKSSGFKVGETVTIMAKAEITETAERERRKGEPSQNVSMQLTDLAIEGVEKSKHSQAMEQKEAGPGGVIDD